MKQKETNLVNWHSRLTLLILSLLLSACSVNETAREAIILTPDDIIPPHITGIDRDLWLDFIYLTNLPDCQLPCFWGLELGEDNMASVLDFLQETEFGRYYERQTANDSSHEVWVTYDGYMLDFRGIGIPDIGDITFFFSFDDESLLRTIRLMANSPSRWLPNEDNPLLITTLLNNLDSVPTLLIESPRNARISNFTFILIYPEYNFQVLYHVDIREAYPLICLNSDNIRYLALDITNYPNRLIEESETFIPIDDSWLVRGSDITTEEFIQFFRDNPDSCLDLSQYPSEG